MVATSIQCSSVMTTLKDWKKSLASGVSVRTLLGLDEEKVPSEKTNKRKLPDSNDKPSTSYSREEALRPSQAASGDDSEVSDFQKFEAALEVKGFLGEPQYFQWSSFPSSILLGDKTVDNPEVNLQPPVPSIALKEVLGPGFIAVLPPSPKRQDDSSTSDEGQ